MIKILRNRISSFFVTGHERTIKAKKNIVASFLIKGLSFAISLALIPITIGYVDATQYGIWITLSSIIGWLSFFDIGLGNGLKNKLAENNATGEIESSRKYISTTYAILIFVSVIIFTIFSVFNHFINWNKILNITSLPNINLNNLATLLVGIFCIQFFIQLINTVLTACHAPAKASLIMFIGQVMCLLTIYVLVQNTKGTILYLVFVLGGIPLIVQFLASVWLYKHEYKHYKPSIKAIDLSYTKSLLSTGGIFFIIQIGSLLLYQTDNIIITQLFGPKEVTIFNISYKYFSIITMTYTILLTPIWSAFTDAYAKNDMVWIKSILNKMLGYWLVMVIGAIGLLTLSSYLISLWLHNSIVVPLTVSIMMCMYTIGYCWLLLHCSLLNGISKIRVQLCLYIFSTLLNIPLAIYLGKYIGLAGVTLSNVIVFIYMGIILRIQCNKIVNGTAKGIWNA